MSVYKSACYRDDTICQVSKFCDEKGLGTEYVKSLMDFNVDDFGDHEVRGLKKGGNLKEMFEEGNVNIHTLFNHRKPTESNAFSRAVEKLPKSLFGLKAVWHVADSLRNFIRKEPLKLSYVNNMYMLGMMSSQHSPGDSRDASVYYLSLQKRILDPIYSRFYYLVNICTSLRTRKYDESVKRAELKRLSMPYCEDPILDEMKIRNCLPMPGFVTFFINGKQVTMMKNDLARVERIVKGEALAKFYILAEYPQTMRRDMLMRLNKLMNEAYYSSNNASFDSIQSLVRCFDVLFHKHLARFASDVSEESYLLQMKKYESERLNRVVNEQKVDDALKGLKMKECLDLLLVYKAFPQPDFDIYGATKRQEELYSKNNSVELSGYTQDIMRHYKWLMISAFYRKHKHCPGTVNLTENESRMPKWIQTYPHCSPGAIPVNDVDKIVFSGAFQIDERGKDVLDLIKDKSICSHNISGCKNAKEYSSLPAHNKNYMLDVLRRDDPIDTRNLNLSHKDVKTDDKPEAKKPNGRWFMEANSEWRLLLSELEDGIGRYASKIDGFVPGKSYSEKLATTFETMMSEDQGDEDIFVSFDIEKFSPRFPILVHKELDILWADAFGFDKYKECSKILEEGNMHYIKKGIHHVIRKTGADYEGFFGKRLTLYHLAVMHTAMEKLKSANIIRETGKYACQIDDGVLKIKLDRNRYKDFCTELEKLWKAAGMQISWDKTYISQNVSVFLNEIFYKGRRVETPMKSVIKITQVAEMPVAHVLFDIQNAESTCRGAIVQGASPRMVYYLYCYHVALSIRRLFKDELLPHKVVWLFAPTALGGMGVKSQIDMCGSLNYDAYTTSMGNLYAIGFRLKSLSGEVKRIASQELRAYADRDSDLITSPIKRLGKTMITNRHVNTAKDRVATFVSSQVLSAMGMTLTNDVNYLKLVAKTSYVPQQVRELINTSTPETALNSLLLKVSSAGTIQGMIPNRTLISINLKNKKESESIIREW